MGGGVDDYLVKRGEGRYEVNRGRDDDLELLHCPTPPTVWMIWQAHSSTLPPFGTDSALIDEEGFNPSKTIKLHGEGIVASSRKKRFHKHPGL